ncbi:hypothetical protein [Actinomadura sp. K4S16]|uniref:hypothetical protein n=1 Tax=Actinomadura sp. K4S16 TaxID=1316147 RepID=UPI0011EEBD4C|nr:hypothetical protein [Actinomadura sp. K4S16]
MNQNPTGLSDATLCEIARVDDRVRLRMAAWIVAPTPRNSRRLQLAVCRAVVASNARYLRERARRVLAARPPWPRRAAKPHQSTQEGKAS